MKKIDCVTCFKDLTGLRFGKWQVVSLAERGKFTKWNCLCDCGASKVVYGNSLKSGKSTSCGCNTLSNKPLLTHGMSYSSEYNSWLKMKSRCAETIGANWRNYGQRCIKVCDRWINSFENFLSDMGAKPSGEYTIERIDVNGSYTPENCKWATFKEQANNRRTNVFININGIEKTISQWAEIAGVTHSTIQDRIKKGITGIDLIKKRNDFFVRNTKK